jgi:hypothetical protein
LGKDEPSKHRRLEAIRWGPLGLSEGNPGVRGVSRLDPWTLFGADDRMAALLMSELLSYLIVGMLGRRLFVAADCCECSVSVCGAKIRVSLYSSAMI